MRIPTAVMTATALSVLTTAASSYGALGNVWHIPQSQEPTGSITMRNPLHAITPSTTIFFYNGSYRYDGDQSGGTLFYKRSTDVAWSSVALSFDSQPNDPNKYWKTSIPSGTFSAGDNVQYYFRITFTDRDTTYLYGYDSTSLKTGVESEAQAKPFTFNVVSSVLAWPGAGYPSYPDENIHHFKEEAVVGNGYMTVMLDLNGTLYDIYFPSTGDRHGVSTANEGYRGPEEFPNCSGLDQQANGQMNVIAGMGGIKTGGNIYWLKNTDGTAYTDVGQRWVSDNVNVVYSTNRFVAAGKNIKVEQYDFAPTTDVLPVISNCPGSLCRTNYGVYVKRFLLTNLSGSAETFDFYYDVNFNVNGGNGHDVMFYDTSGKRNALVAYDRTERSIAPPPPPGCMPDGYTQEYSPSFAFNWLKDSSVYFAAAMKLVTNTTTGAGLPADGSWRSSSLDNQEGWIGKTVTLNPGETKEIDVAVVGSWDDFDSATGSYDFWGKPLVDWFYSNNMSNVQASTETYWSNWLNAGVTIDFPGTQYDTLFRRSLLISALHVDKASGSIIAGMHNGAYPFVWPRDAIYAAITFDRTGHTNEATGAYHWLRDVAYRDFDTGIGDKGFFYQKYTTDGYQVWTSPQIDETASAPWGIYYHYMTTGDATFLTNFWNLVYTSARASSETSSINSDLKPIFGMMNSWNAWEDQLGLHIYSNASIVRGLRDAANIGDIVGSNSWASTLRTRANDIKAAVDGRVDGRIEATDISHFGLAYPYEVYSPDEPRMTNIVEQLHGRQQSGFAGSLSGDPNAPYFDNLVETSGDIAGLVRRFNHKTAYVSIDDYWNGGPWFLSTSWYGMYYARWQDYVGGKALVNTNKYTLDLLIAKLGDMGLGGEQIAPSTGLQKYPGFWLQTAWPNVWESHSTLVDQMMIFLDYKPHATNNTCSFAPKLPTGWSSIGYSNMLFRSHRFDIGVSETATSTRADLNKRTAGALNVDIYLRIPAGTVPALVVTNGTRIPAPSYDLLTGRVRINGPLTDSAQNNFMLVTYGNNDYDGDGLPDKWEIDNGLNPLDDGTLEPVKGPTGDLDGDGQSNHAEFLAGTAANNTASYLRVTSVVREGINMRVTWKAGGGTTNMLQFAPGTVGGSYSNNFGDLPPQLVLPGSGDVTTNKVHSGGGTNVPSGYYRIQLVP